MILKFRKNTYPSGFYQIFEFDTNIVYLKPKENYISGDWQGVNYGIQAELWDKIQITIPVTQSEANDLYETREADEIYIGTTRYEFHEISERTQLGTTEFRSLEIVLLNYTSTFVNFQDYTDVTGSYITLDSNNYYTSLTPIEQQLNNKELINWKGDAQLKWAQKLVVKKIRLYVTGEVLETIQTDINENQLSITISGDSYDAIYVHEFDFSEIARDFYELDITVCINEQQHIPKNGGYKLYIAHEDTTNVPNGWTEANNTDDQLVYESIFSFVNNTERDVEESERTKEKLKESTVIRDKINWLSIHSDDTEIFNIKKYINLCDFVRFVNENTYVVQSGTIDITTGETPTATTSDNGFSDLLIGMNIKVNGDVYNIEEKTSDTELIVSPSPSLSISDETWSAEEQYTIIDAEITDTKNDIGIFEIEYNAIVNESIYYHYK